MKDAIEYDALRYSSISVAVFGILGNALVIISILRQRRLLKNNYYFLVLHLAFCDLGFLVFEFILAINLYFVKKEYKSIVFYCLVIDIEYAFQIAGVYMMMIISVLRYHAAVHPLKHDISRRKWKFVSGLGYVVGLIMGYGAGIPECFVQKDNVAYWTFRYSYGLLLYSASPLVMAVLYYKVYRALDKQDRYLKSLSGSRMTRNTSRSSFNIYSHLRNRRSFFVCLTTVLCYGVGNIPILVHRILSIAGNDWVEQLSRILRVAGSHSVNPLIYGILDRRLLAFWKVFRIKKGKTDKI